MSNIDLSGKLEEVNEKTKLLYLNIPTALIFIYECWEYPKARKFAETMKMTILKSLSKKELRKEILILAKVKSVKKLKTLRPPVYDLFTEVFGNEIWEEING